MKRVDFIKYAQKHFVKKWILESIFMYGIMIGIITLISTLLGVKSVETTPTTQRIIDIGTNNTGILSLLLSCTIIGIHNLFDYISFIHRDMSVKAGILASMFDGGISLVEVTDAFPAGDASHLSTFNFALMDKEDYTFITDLYSSVSKEPFLPEDKREINGIRQYYRVFLKKDN